MKKLTNEQLIEIIANDSRIEELVTRLEKIEKAEEAINEVLENVDGYRNLKIHEIASICYDLEQAGIVSENFFANIAEDEYNYFCELEKEETSMLQRVYIGHTSTFYYTVAEGFEFLDGEIEANRWGYDLLDLMQTIEYNLTFEQVALIKAALKKECDDDELEAINDFIIKENDVTEIDDELFEDLDQELGFLESDIESIQQFTKELKFMDNYLTDYKTTENAIAIIESELTVRHEHDELNLIDVDLSLVRNDEIHKILEGMQHDVKREEQKLTREEERCLFEDTGAVHIFRSTVEDYEFGELPEDHETGYKYFYSYPKNRTVYTDEKVFVFTNNKREYMNMLAKALEDFDTEKLGIDEYTTFF